MPIHPTAIVSPQATLHETVDVGPYAIIDKGVRIGARTRVMAHAYIDGDTTIGEDNVIHMGAIIGHDPQHTAYKGAPRRTVIGNRNIIREYATIHGPYLEEGETRVGDDCYLMTSSHIGHDSCVGNKVIMVNSSMLGGHVVVEDHAFISGNAMLHQFARVGRNAMIHGGCAVTQDVPPFALIAGENHVVGINSVGLKRCGFSAAARMEIKRAFRVLFRQGHSIPTALEMLMAENPGPEVQSMIEFIKASKRGICTASIGVRLAED